MKKLRLASVAFAAGISVMSSSFAADVVADPVVYDWSGIYAGVQGGYGFGDNHWAERSTGAKSLDDGLEGIVGGVTLGANFQMDNNIVLGIEGDGSFSDQHSNAQSNPPFSCGVGCETDVDWFGTVRGRVGWAMGSTMPYLTGGIAFGEASVSNAIITTANNKDTLTGWTAGAGVEHAFTDHLSGKIEYLYTDLGKLDTGPGCAVSCYTDVNFSVVRVGLNFNF